MKTPMSWMIASVLTIGLVSGQQQKSHSQVKVLAVCEVLAEVDRYANSAIVVVGRMDGSVGLIDHYEFLSQDQCEHPLITHGHVWSNNSGLGWFGNRDAEAAERQPST